MVSCKICDAVLGDQPACLSKHIKKHDISQKSYYDTYVACHLGCVVCGNPTKFKSLSNGYLMLCGNKKCLVKYTNPFNISFYMYRGYSEIEAIQKISEIQSNNSKKVDRTKKDIYTAQVDYWLKKGFSQNEAVQKVKERQACGSLENFKKRYGDDDGFNRWKTRQETWQNTLNSKSDEQKIQINKRKGRTFEQLVEQFGIEKTKQICDNRGKSCSKETLMQKFGTEELYSEFCKSRSDKMYRKYSGYSSNKEKELFEYIRLMFPNVEAQFKIYDGRYYLYDMKIDNVIIEFNGDYWHANPTKYSENWINHHNKMTAKEIWEQDRVKRDVALKSNFIVKYVWESDISSKTKFKIFMDEFERELKQCLEKQ